MEVNISPIRGYCLTTGVFYKPNNPDGFTLSQQELLASAVAEVRAEQYDRVVSLLVELLDSIEDPSGVVKLFFSELCGGNELLNRLFQKSWDQFQTLIPKLQDHFVCEVVGEHYFKITYARSNGMECDEKYSLILTKDLIGYSFQEGLEVLATIPYEDQNDLLWGYLNFAKEHDAGLIEKCIEAALKRIEEEGIALSSSDEDELVIFCLEQVKKEPERAYDWISKAEKRLESLASVCYTYHHCALHIAQFYKKRQDTYNLGRMVNLIHMNIGKIKDNDQKKDLLKLLDYYITN